MRTLRYTHWDGRRQPRLDPDHVFERLERLLSYTDDLRRALDGLLRQGFEGPDRRVPGLDEFLEAVRARLHALEAADGACAPELTAEVEALRRLEQQLASGNPQAVALDDLERVLGMDARRDFEGLQELTMVLREGGYLTLREDVVALSPKGIRRIGQLALRDIYGRLLRDRPGSHEAHQQGAACIRPDTVKPYHYGDPLHLDVVATMKRALSRGAGTPLRLMPNDLVVHGADDATRAATVLLLDMSWSMSWDGRFAAAKRVAMALETLVRSRYPRDHLGIVGFFTRAVELRVQDLPEATWNMGDPFTNLQDGLRLAAEIMGRQRTPNQQFIVITDGQPTAYFQQGRLHCEWPLSFGGISPRAASETLREVQRVTRMGITINTFMLDDSPSLRAFVDEMTRINHGRALYTRPDRLGEYLLVDYVSRKRKRI